jgi:SHS2 domain-containing protein
MTSHQFLDHTSETVLQVRADDLPALYAEAVRALGELERAGLAGTGEPVERRLVLESPDPAGLLVDLLNELIWLCETERLAPRSALVRMLGPAALEATVQGERLTATPSFVKAATRHALKFECGPSGCLAEVTLDV